MAFPWKPVVDARSAASRTPSPEAFVIQSGWALLAEAPADPSDPTTPMVVTVGGNPRTRVTGPPAAGQYRVREAWTPVGNEWLGELEFNAADEGLSGTCDYYRTGTIVTAKRWESLIAFCTPIIGYADSTSLAAAVPPSMDMSADGRPGRIAFCLDLSGWWSDGASWQPMANASKWMASLTAAVTQAITQDATWTPPGAALTGADIAAVTFAVAQDAGFDLPAAVIEGATLGATQDATWASGLSLAFVDTFNNSSLDPDRWSALVDGAGSVTETTSLAMSAAGAADGAHVVLKQSLTRGAVATVKFDVAPSPSGVAFNHFWVVANPTQPTSSGAGQRIIAGYIDPTPGSESAGGSYINASGANVDLAMGFAATFYPYRFGLEFTATQFRVVIKNTADTLLQASAWINLSSVQATSDPLWFVFGSANATMTVVRFERT